MQVRPFPRALLLVPLAVAVLPLVTVAIVHVTKGVAITWMMGDIAYTAQVHPLTGFISALGILVWWTAAVTWFFSALIHQARSDRRAGIFAMGFGLLTAYLALDDLFQIHEHLGPNYLHIPQRGVLLGLAIATVVFVAIFHKQILRKDAWLLGLAIKFLGSSLLIDALPKPWFDAMGQWAHLLEDACKWLGLVCWATFAIVRCRVDVLRGQQQPDVDRKYPDRGVA